METVEAAVSIGAAADRKQRRSGKRKAQKAPVEDGTSKEAVQIEVDAGMARPPEVTDAKKAAKEAREMDRLQRSAARLEKEEKKLERERIEKKEKISLQRQADIMGRFLRMSKGNAKPVQADAAESSVPCKVEVEQPSPSSATESYVVEMDRQMQSGENLDVGNLRKNHLSEWRLLPRKQFPERWGLRLKPKISWYTELRLSGKSGTSSSQTRKRDRADLEAGDHEKLDVEGDDSSVRANDCSLGEVLKPDGFRKCQRKRRKLLQFDKSHRPAYYGTYSKRSTTVRARRPLTKEQSLDYDIDSDEEWEEEEPGESLSDCEKDEEDEKADAEEEDENSDGFMVPDGYLSESEGVHLEDTDSEDAGESPSPTRLKSTRDDPNTFLAEDNIDVHAFERLLKVLDNATDHAVRCNRPLVINMMRSNSNYTSASQGPQTGLTKTQRLCLQALRVVVVSPRVLIEPPNDCFAADKLQTKETASRRGRKKRIFALSDSSFMEFIQVLMTSPTGIKKTRELLVEKFPHAPKGFLNAKIHEVADYVDNRWQVKSEVLEQQGLICTTPKEL